jgi:hypothetical protein
LVDTIEVDVTNLSKKHPGKPAYEGFHSLTKHIYHDNGEVVIESYALDKEALEILRAKIMVVLIDKMTVKKN